MITLLLLDTPHLRDGAIYGQRLSLAPGASVAPMECVRYSCGTSPRATEWAEGQRLRGVCRMRRSTSSESGHRSPLGGVLAKGAPRSVRAAFSGWRTTTPKTLIAP